MDYEIQMWPFSSKMILHTAWITFHFNFHVQISIKKLTLWLNWFETEPPLLFFQNLVFLRCMAFQLSFQKYKYVVNSYLIPSP